MKRSEHFPVFAVNCLSVYSLSVNGREYAISGVSPDNKFVLHCLDANDIVCEYSYLSLGSSHIFVNDCEHELYVVDKGDDPVSFLANWKRCCKTAIKVYILEKFFLYLH